MSYHHSGRTWMAGTLLAGLGLVSEREIMKFNLKISESAWYDKWNDRGERTKFLTSALSDSIEVVSSYNHSKVVDAFFTYDLSAKRALIDLYNYIDENDIALPLFSDRLAAGLGGARIEPAPKVCAMIISQRRIGSFMSYLIQSVSSLLNRMNFAKYRDSFYFHVVNVDKHPNEHKEVEIIRDLVPVTNIITKVNADFVIPHKLQEVADYAQLIRLFDTIGCQYPIIFEDDALPREDWADTVMTALQNISDLGYGTDRKWFATKLFINKEEPPSTPGIYPWPHVWFTVAMMYNSELWLTLAETLEELVERSLKQGYFDFNEAKDYMVDRAARSANSDMLAYEPVICQHTGLASSLEEKRVEDFGEAQVLNEKYRFSPLFPSEGIPIVFNETHWQT